MYINFKNFRSKEEFGGESVQCFSVESKGGRARRPNLFHYRRKR
jgi:hypothetical protein